MTETEIEAVVRRYCAIMKIDPDEWTDVPCPDNRPGCCVAHFGPAWKNYVERVKDILAWKEAIGL